MQESEDTANRDVDRMRTEEEKTMSQADTAASEAEHERDAAETERFDAENAAKRSSIAEAQVCETYLLRIWCHISGKHLVRPRREKQGPILGE